MSRERRHPLTFQNSDGHRLFGILHEPLIGARRDVAIILLSPGVKNRIAPHRMYNKMAAEYVALGFWVFRFDFYGLGDSEGEVREPLLPDLYGSIQVGRYCDDTRCAMEWMRRTYGFKQFILGGLCGGAITGVLAGAHDPAVVGLLGLGLPVMLDGSSVDKIRNMTAGQLDRIRQRYVRKIFNPSAWLRLLSFKTDFRQLLRAFTASRRKRPAPAAAAGGPAAPPAGSNANPKFPPAFLAMLASGRPVLMLFSGSDRLYAEFQEKFLAFYQDRVNAHARYLDVEVVDRANHIFSFPEWQREMLDRTRTWLEQRFPAPAEAMALTGAVDARTHATR
jgi:hypothetical protein